MITPEQLREITLRARKDQRELARRWLVEEGYSIMETTANRGEFKCFFDAKPGLLEILTDAGFKVKYIPETKSLFVSWDITDGN